LIIIQILILVSARSILKMPMHVYNVLAAVNHGMVAQPLIEWPIQ